MKAKKKIQLGQQRGVRPNRRTYVVRVDIVQMRAFRYYYPGQKN